MRKNIEYCTQNIDGVLALVFGYLADCWECGWPFEAVTKAPIPDPGGGDE